MLIYKKCLQYNNEMIHDLIYNIIVIVICHILHDHKSRHNNKYGNQSWLKALSYSDVMITQRDLISLTY